MPGRVDVFENTCIYHVFNRTIDKKRIFLSSSFIQYFLESIYFYRSTFYNRSFSNFRYTSFSKREELVKMLDDKNYFQIDILSYCIMPTHYHLLLSQCKEKGIQHFMMTLINSFTRYYNLKQNRIGPIFLPRFQSRRIITEEQLIHVSRYQHLNPYSSGLISSLQQLEHYPWSSYQNYISQKESKIVNTQQILDYFQNDKKKYQKFVEDQADYQKLLEEYKYIKL